MQSPKVGKEEPLTMVLYLRSKTKRILQGKAAKRHWVSLPLQNPLTWFTGRSREGGWMYGITVFSCFSISLFVSSLSWPKANLVLLSSCLEEC